MLLRKTRDFGDKISDTVQYIRTYLKDLLMLYLVFVVPLSLVAVLLGSNVFSSLAGLANSKSLLSSSNDVLKIFTPSLFLTILLYMASTASYATVMYLHMRMVDEQPGKPSYFNEVASRFMPKFLTNLAYSALLIVAAVLSALVAIVPVLGIVLLIFGWIYVFVNLSLMPPSNTIEDRPFPGAIPRAFTLMRGEFWSSFGFLLILGIIFYFFSMIISLIVLSIFGIASMSITQSDPSQFTSRYFLINGISGLIGQVFYIILHIGTGILFFSLRELKEGGGLESRIENLGGGGSTLPEEQY